MFNRLRSVTPIEIFIVLVIASLTVFLVKFYTTKPLYRTVRIEVTGRSWNENDNYDPNAYRPPFWLSDKIVTGLSQKDKAGRVAIRIDNLENYDRGNGTADIFLTAKLLVTQNSRSGDLSFQNQPLNLGGPIALTLDNISLNGQIVDNNVPDSGYPRQDFTVTFRARSLPPALYSQIIPGLEMVNRADNSPAVTVTSVSLEPATVLPVRINNPPSMLSVGTGTQNKDAVITAKVAAYKLDHNWYFAGGQYLKAGATPQIFLTTSAVNLFGLEIETVKTAP